MSKFIVLENNRPNHDCGGREMITTVLLVLKHKEGSNILENNQTISDSVDSLIADLDEGCTVELVCIY